MPEIGLDPVAMVDSGIKDSIIPYTYEPLPKDADFIRLMHLEPALDSEAPLHFTFTSNEIGSLVAQYEAISYTWGELNLKYALNIDGTRIMITRNLDKVLRRLRHPTISRTLWTDAVCINQSDNEEKAQQIPLMSEIYRNASRVVAWLDGGSDEERGMHMLDLLSRPPQLIQDRSERKKEMEKLGFSSFFVRRFLSLAWFTRLWVIQEVVLNTDIVLLCGSSEISWLRLNIALPKFSELLDDFREGLTYEYKYHLERLEKVAQLWEIHSLKEKRKLRHPRPQRKVESILDLMNAFHGYGCSDGRDRIFALYNLTSDIQPAVCRETLPMSLTTAEDSAIKKYPPIYLDVDYTLDVRQTYQQLAVACIASDRGALTLEEAIRRHSSDQSLEDWPSWVPDWRKARKITDHREEYGTWHADVSYWTKDVHVQHISPDFVGVSTCDESPFIFVVEYMTPVFEQGVTNDFASFLSLHLAPMPDSILNVLKWLMLSPFDADQIKEYLQGVYEESPGGMRLDSALQEAVRGRHFFVAYPPGLAHYVLGHSDASTPMEKGDAIVYPGSRRAFYSQATGWIPRYRQALLVRRRAVRFGIEQRSVPTYRLIGTVWIRLARMNPEWQGNSHDSQGVDSITERFEKWWEDAFRNEYVEECNMVYLE
ncbi:hypothetical protein HBI38_072470 [Parastagonospora nodorum]|nr:hypothetical protein HBH51_030820 [Parastagonospora nodorum]KAH5164885.1 hypothetical protein HBI73_040570 [Parastagonospora nodorum]KAH6273754.1 hypothetical protein HBI41_073700 [Parastagonospora nodorum]KAH6294003.1 hypothetical protein HBI40_065800 [Parastagonospora nodorum]KAH6324623.1 hypothetical protein HBI38_072470 [Parastagonospora nodorum]